MFLERVKAIVTEPWNEVELRPLLLFRGSLTLGNARRRLNFLRAAMLAEVPDVTALSQLSKAEHDVAHLCGLHAKSGWERMSVAGFFGRVLLSPSILHRAPGLDEYIYWLLDNTPSFEINLLDRIPEFNKWSTRDWRRPPRKPREQLTEYYPFIRGQATEDHELIIAVDALVPKVFMNDVRADVCQDMLVAILSGEVTLDNLKDGLPKYLKQFLKGAPSKYGHLSLDGPAGVNDTRTLGEALGL